MMERVSQERREEADHIGKAIDLITSCLEMNAIKQVDGFWAMISIVRHQLRGEENKERFTELLDGFFESIGAGEIVDVERE